MFHHRSFRTIYWLLFCLLIILVGAPPTGGAAQQGEPPGPVYIVQEGDTLWDIAVRFGISLEELQNANSSVNANQLAVGDRLIIPGVQGFNGEVVAAQVGLGETLRSLSRRYGLPVETLAQLNRLASPEELYAGAPLIIPAQSNPDKPVQAAPDRRVLVRPGQSLLELALLQGANPWSIALVNDLPGHSQALPGDVLFLPGGSETGDLATGAGALPGEITLFQLEPDGFFQGRTTRIMIQASEPVSLTGSLLDHPLNFFSESQGKYVALQGLHAMTRPGVYPLYIRGELEDGAPFAFSQMALAQPVDYPYDQPLTVNPATIDPAVTKPEDAQWTALALPTTPEKYWQGKFLIPSPLEQDYCLQSGECWTSRFGNRRSYNGSPYNYFHTGLDIAGREGVEIYAPAAGVVVFSGPLTVRGNATMIDHGWGVYTGYMHQSEILVKPGDHVEAGQLIGRVGSTGRVEGPHLHWEVWVGEVQVDPLEWLENVYP